MPSQREKTVLSVFRLRPRRIGGIETMAKELSAQLAALGWRSVLCFQGEPTALVSEFLSSTHVDIETIEDLSAWNLAANRCFAQLLRRYRPAIVHLNFVDFLSPYAWLAKLHGVQHIFFSDHISQPADSSAGRAKPWKRAAYRLAVPTEKVLCVSDYLASNWLQSARLPSEKISTVYNAVDVDRCRQSSGAAAQFRHRFAIPEHCTVVTQVASMIPEKGFHDVIRAARKVIDRQPDTRFVFVGDGPGRQEYEKLADSLGVAQNTMFTGLIDDPVAEGVFAATDVLCQASRWQEAFGLVIAEAMACGKPVVATRVGGIPELVDDGETGYLVECGNADALAQRILELANNNDLCRRFGEAGRQRCQQLFDHRRYAAKIVEHYGLKPAHSSNNDYH